MYKDERGLQVHAECLLFSSGSGIAGARQYV
jgi:hypothetical protein